MSIYAKAKSPSVSQLSLFYKLYDMLLSQKMYLFAMLDYAKAGGGSRGSALYTDSTGELPGFPGCQTLENYIAADWTRKCMARKSRK